MNININVNMYVIYIYIYKSAEATGLLGDNSVPST